jgi:peroxiredoxin Q/BCP
MSVPSLIKKALLALAVGAPGSALAEPLAVGKPAPVFQLKTHDGGDFNLESRRGKGWTVLYFYPKAGTPGCTTQACAFRDAIKAIRDQDAEVYGISTDPVGDLAAFHQKYHLNFPLISDPEAAATEAYGVKLPVMKMAKRWTFIVDPDLVVRHINDQVDPGLDAKAVAATLKRLKSSG